MATIKEDYCSKETYRLLREKGFDGEIHTSYDEEGYTQASITLQMAMKWLREVHNIHIIPYLEIDSTYSFVIYIISKAESTIKIVGFEIDENYYWNKIEEACEAAIKYCLEKLI